MESLSEQNGRRWAFELRPRGSGPVVGADEIIQSAQEIFEAFKGHGLKILSNKKSKILFLIKK